MESNIINEIEGNKSLCSKKANIYKIFMNIKKMFNNDNKETKSKLYFFINLLLSRRDIDNSFKKIIIVNEDIIPKHQENGITILGLKDFLLNKNSLDLA